MEWLSPKPAIQWLEVGCGTGALTSTICERCDPASIVACDPSVSFIEHARNNLSDTRVSFSVAGAATLPTRSDGFDLVVSGLVLNFLPDPGKAVASMRERLRPGGMIASYVWDYAGGMEFLRFFWDEAVAADPKAIELDEGRRFPLCRTSALATLFREAHLVEVETDSLEISTDFDSFDDYWTPFLRGTGPAPSYVASLDPLRQSALRERLQKRLRAGDNDRIQLRARAWAVRGVSN